MQHQAKVASVEWVEWVAVVMATDQQVLQELEPLLHQQMAN
jgi:hypothetical protein